MKNSKVVKIVKIRNIRPDALELRVTKSFLRNEEWEENNRELDEIKTNEKGLIWRSIR